MLNRLLLSLSYVAPAVGVAAIALQAAGALAGTFTELKAKAAEQELGVPPLVRIYFRSTLRTLYVSGLLALLAMVGDVVLHAARPSLLTAHIFGYSSALLMLVCGFALLVEGGVDRQLKLFSGRARTLHSLAGAGGMAAGAWGVALVTWQGGVWGF
ncbi:MAG: hypothetical protein KDB82_17710 [Planctomycetes bacterium]|nr:hypothetical protein [Planctomycetota bacterium]